MSKKEQIELMADRVVNNLLAKASNDLYHDYREIEDEFNALFKELKHYLNQAKEHFFHKQSYLIEANKKEKQLLSIQQQLTKWRKERHLSIESQQKNLTANILEELTEFARAQTDEERIDALCDICVFTINSYDKDLEYFNHDYNLNPRDIDSLSLYILDNIKSHIDILSLCFYSIQKLGYDPYKCMLETIKEISNRTGHYDDSIGKFIKDEGYYSLHEALLANPKCVITRSHDKYRLVDENKTIRYANVWEKANYNKCKIQL